MDLVTGAPHRIRSPEWFLPLQEEAGIVAGRGSMWEDQELSTHRRGGTQLTAVWFEPGEHLLSHVTLDTPSLASPPSPLIS